MSVGVYKKAIGYARNTIKGLVHTYRKQSIFEPDEIVISVAEDCFIKSLEKEMSNRDIVIFCKYRVRQLYFEERKHRVCAITEEVEQTVQTDRVISKRGHYTSVEVLKKRDIVKKLTLDGKTNDEIIAITGYPRSTIHLYQKQSGVNANNSRSKYTQEQADFVKAHCENMTQKQIGELMGLKDRQVEKIARNYGIYFPNHGGRKKGEI
ncbi:MAG: hypothetical protein Q4F84_01130 [Fibrobacter sp.]|nr:hypothetical protein [Fibrobacter sp.]